MTKAIAWRPAEPTVPNIPGLADTIRQLNSERAAWAANGDQWSKARAVHFAEQIEALHALDPALVERVSLARDARGAMAAQITPREPPPKRKPIPARPAPAKVVKTIRTHKDAAGNIVAEVIEGPAPSAQVGQNPGEKTWLDEPEPELPADLKAIDAQRKGFEELLGEALYRVVIHRTVNRVRRDWKELQGAHSGNRSAAVLEMIIQNEVAGALQDNVSAKRIRELEGKVAALEARRELRYLGVWKKDEKYVENSAVTHDGQIWIAKADTVERPGGNVVWQLAVRKGQDAK